MNYISTRGDQTPRGFSEILLEGLAPDGGLYLPTHYPKVDAATLARWRGLSYAELAFEILSLYIDDIPAADLKRLVTQTYTEQVFGTREIVPLKKLEDGPVPEALSNGPTLAFKDMAMQLLGALFEYELARRGRTLNILGATSGDTGSAAEYAMRGKKGVGLHAQPARPHEPVPAGADVQPAGRQHPQHRRRGRVRRLPGHRQGGVERPRVQAPLEDRHRQLDQLGAPAGPGRLLLSPAGSRRRRQRRARQLRRALGQLRQHLRRPRGAHDGPAIHRLVLPPTRNNVLDEFFRTGTYRVRGSAETYETSSPSMDISKASNFERFVFDLLGRDAARTRRCSPTRSEAGAASR